MSTAVQTRIGGITDRLVRALASQDKSARIALLIILATEAVYFTAASSQFLTRQNLLTIGSSVAVLAIVSTGTTFGLISGALDISVGSTVGLAGYAATRLSATDSEAWLSILVAIGIGIAVGLVNGFVVVKLRVNPIVATLGMLSIVRGIAYYVAGGSGEAISPNATESSVFSVMQGNTLGIPRPVLVAIVFMVCGYFVLQMTRFGLYTFAIGRNPTAARDLALRVDRLRITCLVLSGMCAGAAGWVLSSSQAGSNANAAIGLELTVITAIIIGGAGLLGGTGSMIGTGLGVVVLGVMVNGMSLLGIDAFYQLMGQGALLLAAVGLDAFRSGGYT
jgi:ribose/xylose/arabinose/galactoside ABC-type transport system permease subunit